MSEDATTVPSAETPEGTTTEPEATVGDIYVTKTLPFLLRKLLPAIKERTTVQDQDCILVISGPKGSGKTTLALLLHMLYDQAFSINDQISFEYDQIKQRWPGIPRGKGHHIDEIRFGRMDFRTKMGVAIGKMLNESRIWNHFETYSTPHVERVLPVFLEHAHYYAQFIRPGTFILLRRNDSIIRGSPFGLNDKDLRYIVDERSFIRQFIDPAKRAKTYIGTFTIPQYPGPVTPEVYAAYRAIRSAATEKMLQQEEEDTTAKTVLRTLRDRWIWEIRQKVPREVLTDTELLSCFLGLDDQPVIQKRRYYQILKEHRAISMQALFGGRGGPSDLRGPR